MNFAEKVIRFNETLQFEGELPPGIGIMNPFKERPEAALVSAAFYRKYYSDNERRQLILGINPGRFGAGLTGVPFTDPKRLKERCALPYTGEAAHEPSSVFVYDVIEAYGGPEAFYRRFYINSVCPLGFTRVTEKGGVVNYNYYDSRELTEAVRGFIVESIQRHIALGVYTDVCFCFGTGDNYRFLERLNGEYQFFGRIVPLDHPRFVMQYKAKSKDLYVQKYLDAFRLNMPPG